MGEFSQAAEPGSHEKEGGKIGGKRSVLARRGNPRLNCLYDTGYLCPSRVRFMKEFSKNYEQTKNKKTSAGEKSPTLVGFSDRLSVLALLGASSLRLLAALYARAFIMLTLAELGKHTRLRTGTLKSSQRTVQGFIFLYADFRHRFPSLRATLFGRLKARFLMMFRRP